MTLPAAASGEPGTALVFALAAGVALAAVAGLRAFLPLFAAGLAARSGLVPLGPDFEWLASTPALLAFGSACLLEILADKVPAVDHALDAFGLVVKPLAGALAAAALTLRLGPLWTTVLAVIAGGSVAGAVAVGKAKARLGSSLFSFGAANPLVSLAEDVFALAGVVLAVFLPLLALAALAVLGLSLWVLLRLLARAGRRPPLPVRPAG